ncbi:MAG: Ldh family oxidoreductase [Nitriliruptorales bacterium]|nr:Ldh family oxidoreductase [Nitriliruptorales bacterium]
MAAAASDGERLRLDATRLRRFCAEALSAAGATAHDAAVAAAVLVRTDLRGVHSHGVQTLPFHVKNLRDGGTCSPTRQTVVRSTPVTAVVDGNGGLGLVIATAAMAMAVGKARDSGIGVVLVRNSNHFGAAGHYALAAAEAGFIGLATSNASPIMTAAGSAKKVISNAPLAYAVPTGRFPLALDIAMSATAGMKVRLAAERGEAIPEGWVVDAGGMPTTNPGDYAAGGALAPLGGHKGYGMALLTETLAGALSGAAMTRGVVPWLVDTGTPTNAGHAFVALDVECFMGRDDFYRRMQQLIGELHAAEPAPGVERVLVPGELEHLREQDALERGLELEPVIWHHLEQVADSLGLTGALAAARRD